MRNSGDGRLVDLLYTVCLRRAMGMAWTVVVRLPSAGSGQALDRLGPGSAMGSGRSDAAPSRAFLNRICRDSPVGRQAEGGGQVFSVCRRCVQFSRQCVHFWPRCVQ